MIKMVIFDLDGTMYDYEACNRIAMEALAGYFREQFGVEREAFFSLHRQAMRQVKEQIGYDCAAIHNRLIRYQWMLEQTGAPLFPHALELTRLYWQTMLDEMEPFDGLIPWMRRLKGKGIRIGVGTNMTAYIQYRKLEKLGVSDFVDWLVTSEEAGVEKPDPKFFAACQRKSGILPKECLFVGDSLKSDIRGALTAGMQALHCAPETAEAEPPAKASGSAEAEPTAKASGSAEAEPPAKASGSAEAEPTAKASGGAAAEWNTEAPGSAAAEPAAERNTEASGGAAAEWNTEAPGSAAAEPAAERNTEAPGGAAAGISEKRMDVNGQRVTYYATNSFLNLLCRE